MPLTMQIMHSSLPATRAARGLPWFIRENAMWLNCIELGLQTMLLGMEAHSVIGLRLKKIGMGGPAAMLEAQHMVAEKIAAFAEATGTLVTSGSARTVIRRFREQVQENEARLSKVTPRLTDR